MGKWGAFISETAFTALVAAIVCAFLIFVLNAEGLWVTVITVIVSIPAGKAIADAVARADRKRSERTPR